MTNETRDLWKQAAIFLAGIIIALIPSIAALMKDTVTSAEMQSYVREEAPYLRDRQLILGAITSGKEQRISLETKIEKLIDAVVKLDHGIEKLNIKLKPETP